jgi:hypothetical protein
MSSTGYGILIYDLSRLCHITVVWVSNQEAHWIDGYNSVVDEPQLELMSGFTLVNPLRKEAGPIYR